MYCLAISQKHDSQITFTHFTNLSPTTNSTILLDEFILWKFHSPNYPFVLDYCTIGAVSVDVKVVCDFHSPMVAEWAGREISTKTPTGCRNCPRHPAPDQVRGDADVIPAPEPDVIPAPEPDVIPAPEPGTSTPPPPATHQQKIPDQKMSAILQTEHCIIRIFNARTPLTRCPKANDPKPMT